MRAFLAKAPHVTSPKVIFVNLLAPTLPVTFVDFRPVTVRMSGVWAAGAINADLCISDDGEGNLSSVHVREYVGLGRYGDSIDLRGARKNAAELLRPQASFEAQRVHVPTIIQDYFSARAFAALSAANDRGELKKYAELPAFSAVEYGWGLFRFRKST